MNAVSQRAKEIFLTAIQGDFAEAVLDAYLEQACAGDAELRRRVEALLSAHAVNDSFLKPASMIPANLEPPTAADGVLGDYRTPSRDRPGRHGGRV